MVGIGGSGMPLALMVCDIARGANTADVVALNNAGVVPALPNGSKFIIGPIAADELQMQVEQIVPTPQDYGNYNQLFMCQIEVGDYADAHAKEVNWGWKEIHEYTIMDFRTRRSLAYYFGYGSKAIDPIANVSKYTTSGIRRQIKKLWPAPNTPWTDNDFIDFAKYVHLGAKGSKTKIVLGGDNMIANMSKAPFVQKQLQAQSTEVVFGMTFDRIKTNFGELLVSYEPLFTMVEYSDDALVLDPEFIVRTNFNGMHYDKLQLKGAGTRRVRAESIAEASAAQLRNLEAHCWATI